MAARRAAALLALAVAAIAAVPAHAQRVERSARSLKDVDSTFVRAAYAPETTFQRAGTEGGLQAASPPATTFATREQADTVFRAAEVPPARIAVTRQLLTELQARQTPQQAIVVDLPADVLFDFDRAEIRADAHAALGKAAELLKSYPQAPVSVHGHTDGKGSDAYNDALSLRRAQAVAGWLARTDSRPLAIQGFGKREPVAANARPDGSDDPDGRQRNRRVAIVIGRG